MRKELKLKFNFMMYDSKFKITIAKENLSLKRYSDLVKDYLVSVIKKNSTKRDCYVCSQSNVTDTDSKNFCYYLDNDGEKDVNRYVYCEELEKDITFSIDIIDVTNILSESQIFDIIKYIAKNIPVFNNIFNYSSESEIEIEANNIYTTLSEYEKQITRSVQIYKTLHCDMDSLTMVKNEGNSKNYNWNSYVLTSCSTILNPNVLGYYFKTNINNSYVIVFKVINSEGLLSDEAIYELLHILSARMVGRE